MTRSHASGPGFQGEGSASIGPTSSLPHKEAGPRVEVRNAALNIRGKDFFTPRYLGIMGNGVGFGLQAGLLPAFRYEPGCHLYHCFIADRCPPSKFLAHIFGSTVDSEQSLTSSVSVLELFHSHVI